MATPPLRQIATAADHSSRTNANSMASRFQMIMSQQRPQQPLSARSRPTQPSRGGGRNTSNSLGPSHSLAVEEERNTVLNALSKCSLFNRHFETRKSLAELLPCFEQRDWKEGDRIVQEGEVGTSLFVLVAGACSLTIDGQAISRASKGSCIGETGLEKAARRSATATVVSKEGARTWSLERLQYKLLLHDRRQLKRRQLLNGSPVDGSESKGVHTTPEGHGRSREQARSKSVEVPGYQRPRRSRSPSPTGGRSKSTSPQVGNYATRKWIRSRHSEKVANRALSNLQAQEDPHDGSFTDALKYLFQEFDVNNDEKINWMELNNIFLALEKALPAHTVHIVRQRRQAVTEAHRRDGIEMGFTDFKVFMRSFDLLAQKKGFSSLQDEKRKQEGQEGWFDFPDFLRTFAMRQKVMAMMQPARERQAQNNRKRNVLYQTTPLSPDQFASTLQSGAEKLRRAKSAEKVRLRVLSKFGVGKGARRKPPSAAEQKDFRQWKAASNGIVRRRDKSPPPKEVRDRPQRLVQRRKQSALSIARELLGTQYSS